MKIMITGHRPPRLKGQEQKVKEWVSAVVAELAKKEKIEAAYCGMAQGADQIFFRVVAALFIPIYCCYPWKKKDMDFIEEACLAGIDGNPPYTRVWLYDKYPGKCGYIERDRYMVDHSDVVLAVWDGVEQGGTWDTIEYARSKGKQIIYLEV